MLCSFLSSTFAQRTTQDRSRRLLEILPSRGSKAFSVFVESLREDYDWLADSLEDEATTRQYEIDSRNLATSKEKCRYENASNSIQEENLKVCVIRKNLFIQGLISI